MSGRLSVTTGDLHRLLDVTDLAKLDEPGGPLPWSLLYGLSDIVTCDAVTYESHDVMGRTVQRQQTICDVGDEFFDRAIPILSSTSHAGGAHENQQQTENHPTVCRMLAASQSHDAADAESTRRLGIHDAVIVALPSDAGLHYRLILWRFTGQEFTQRDCLLLTLIYPHLVTLHAAVLCRHAHVLDLTPRQWQLMQLIAAGATNRQIALRLGLSEGTVRTHCENIFNRLNVTNRVAAIARAFPNPSVSMAFVHQCAL